MRSVFFISLILIPFLSTSQADYSKAKERALNQLQEFEYATLKWLITSEQKNNESKRSAKPQKDVNLKRAFGSETGDLQLFLNFGTEFKSDDNMKILKKISSYNNIVDVLNLLGSFGWSLAYVDESIIEEGKMMTYYFKK